MVEGRLASDRQNYPFQPNITLTVAATRPVRFPLELRIPGWCNEPSVRVNSEPVEGISTGTFLRIERTWQTGDKVDIHFPMTMRVSHWLNDSVAITRGTLVFSLLIDEEWKTTADYGDGHFHAREIRPVSPWNYAILLDDKGIVSAEVALTETMPRQPFKAVDAPVKLTLRAFRTSEGAWGTYSSDFPARAVEPPVSPVTRQGKLETITLVPYGSTELRITHFPWAND